jgi:hypothetical protein
MVRKKTLKAAHENYPVALQLAAISHTVSFHLTLFSLTKPQKINRERSSSKTKPEAIVLLFPVATMFVCVTLA